MFGLSRGQSIMVRARCRQGLRAAGHTAPKPGKEHRIHALSSLFFFFFGGGSFLINQFGVWTARTCHFRHVEPRGQLAESLSPPPTWVPGVTLRLLGLEASTSAHQGTSTAHLLLFIQCRDATLGNGATYSGQVFPTQPNKDSHPRDIPGGSSRLF